MGGVTHPFPVVLVGFKVTFEAHPQFEIKCIFINDSQHLSSLSAGSSVHLAPVNIREAGLGGRGGPNKHSDKEGLGGVKLVLKR